MLSTLGDRKTFAIEYEVVTPDPPYGSLRFWIDGIWFGDINRQEYFHHLARMLSWLVRRESCPVRVLYEREAEVPDEESLLNESWNWGDSFDDFLFVLYAVDADRLVHFVWILHHSRHELFPDYPAGIHHARIPFRTFDSVVKQFLRQIGMI